MWEGCHKILFFFTIFSALGEYKTKTTGLSVKHLPSTPGLQVRTAYSTLKIRKYEAIVQYYNDSGKIFTNVTTISPLLGSDLTCNIRGMWEDMRIRCIITWSGKKSS